MRLHVTVAAAPGLNLSEMGDQTDDGLLSGLNRRPAELVLDLDSPSGCLLEDRLNHEIPCPALFWVDGIRLSDLTAGQPPLVSGAVILAAPLHACAPWRPQQSPDALTFSVQSGPDTGRLHILKRGRYTIGRTTADIHIADPKLSRQHAALVVEPTAIRIDDQGSANGTVVDGSAVESAIVTTASLIRIGTSVCALRFNSEFHDLDSSSVDPSKPLIVRREAAAQRRGIMVITAILPVTIGVALALITGMWMFLAFSAMSALTMLIPVLGGRKRRRKFRLDLETANREDAARRKAATPSAAESIRHTIHHARQRGRNAEAPNGPATSGRDLLAGWIRLGTADQPANVRLDPPDSEFSPTLLHGLPVSLNLSGLGPFHLGGNAQQVTALLRTLIVQVSSWTEGGSRRLVFYGPSEEVPLEVRFLPRAELVQTLSGLFGCLQGSDDHSVAIFISATATVTNDLRVLLRELAAKGQLIVVHCVEQPSRADVPAVTLLRDRAILKDAESELEFVPDLIDASTFERYCRNSSKLEGALGYGSTGRKSAQALPRVKALDTLIDPVPDRVLERWHTDTNDRFDAPVGVYSTAELSIDLEKDGPHLLIAGTTGSGKSELLRTLIVSMSLCHSPALINFLLVDFKGGSGLSSLRKLPHSVGLLTDLSAESMARAMESLRAEIRRRESLFAKVEAADLASYRRLRRPDMEQIPRLVVVIDEFRMLLEEVPSAMDELLRIAAVGRSLGLHLIMATQRPQGAVSADIRANITTSIALRVQTPMESQDILGTSDAAGISVGLPGRAYVKRSGEPVREFQSASSSLITAANHHLGIRTVERFLRDDAGEEPTQNEHDDGKSMLRYVASAVEAWRALDGPQPFQPVLSELPDRLDVSAVLDSSREEADARRTGMIEVESNVTLGLLDIPSRQDQLVLQWAPRRDSHLAVIGGPRSGVNSTLRHVTRQLLTHNLDSTHLYVLDGDGSLPGLGENPHVGAYVTGHDLRHAARIIQRLGQTTADRLTGSKTPAADGKTAHDFANDSSTAALPTLILIVAGWGRWLTAFRSSPWAQAEDVLHDIVRDGSKASVTVFINGDRELVTSRLFAGIENRLFLPTGASAESLMSWPRLPPMRKVPGRAYAEGVFAPHQGIAQLLPCHRNEWQPQNSLPSSGASASNYPFRIEPLPRKLREADLPVETTGPADVLVGVKGDELEPALIRIPPGSVYLVLGGPGSGKSEALRMLAAKGAKERQWVHMQQSFEDDPEGSLQVPNHDRIPSPLPEATEPTTVLVDDADRLSSTASHRLMQLHARGYGIIMSASTNPALMSRIPLASAARADGRGMILMPQSPFDADFFGQRIEPDPTSTPGRAAIIDGAQYEEAQLVLLQD